MFDFRLELCRSKVFCAENGEGRTIYLLKVNHENFVLNFW